MARPTLTSRGTARCFVLASWLVLLMPCASAAQNTPGTLTLQAAMDRALAANPSIAAARLARAIDVAGRAVGAERLNPEATVEIEKEAPKQAFGLALPIELGGKRAKRIAVGDATIRAGDAELAATIAQIRNDVRRAYFDVLVTEAKLGVLRELQDLSRRATDAARTRFDSGDVPRLEVLQAELALAAAQNEATAAEGLNVAARTRLNAVLGLPLDTVPSLATTIDAAGPVALNAVVDLARSSNAALTVLDRRIDTQKARLALARSLRVPDLVPSAALTHDAQPEFTYGWRAGVAVTVPLLTSHRAGVALEDATLTQLMAERQAEEARINGEVTAAAAEAEAQRQAYQRYRDVIVPRAQEVEQLAQDSYQLGQTGIAALLQSLQASRDVRLRSLDAASEWQTALADLERAIGAPLP